MYALSQGQHKCKKKKHHTDNNKFVIIITINNKINNENIKTHPHFFKRILLLIFPYYYLT